MKKLKFFENFHGKIKNFLTRIHHPQFSSQLDATAGELRSLLS